MEQPPTTTQPGGRADSLLIALGLALAVSYRFFEPIWRVGGGALALGVLTGGAYLAARLVHRRAGRRSRGSTLWVWLVVSQPVLLALGLLGLPVSRIAVVCELVLLLIAVAAAGACGSGRIRARAALGFAGVSALPTLVGLVAALRGHPAEREPLQRYVFTSYHDISVVDHTVLPDEHQDGGALTLLPDGQVLLVAGSGAARLLDFGDSLRVADVEIESPIDPVAYRSLGRRQPEFYRVFDAFYSDSSLFVSHVQFDSERDCYAVRLIEAAFDGRRAGPWTTRFESRPCLTLEYTRNTSGGRIAALDASHLLLTVGTFGLDLLDPARLRADSDYGKLLVLDRETWRSEVYTSGHRNPEGLLVAGEKIWSTEHGPHGGDELNLITRGSDYGWPLVSYGTDYGHKTLASGAEPGDHTGFTPPVHAWIPSVGISNLIQVEGDLFPRWRGDLLIASLSGLGNGQALFRVRVRADRVVTAERIPVGGRVRDLLQLPGGGPIVLWDGGGSIRVVRPADHVFSRCSGCHGLRAAAHGIGPDLFGVVGSPVARHADFPYSEGLRQLGGTWTPARLDRFIEDPQRAVPGTSMEHEGVADPVERARIIQFLSEISAGRPRD